MPRVRILVVDDEKGMQEVCRDTLEDLASVEIVTEGSAQAALERLENEPFHLLVADVRMPGFDGVELLRRVRKLHPDLPALMITAYPTVESAVQAMKLGAADYISKPFRPEELRKAVARLLEERRLEEENRLLRRQVERPYMVDTIISASSAMLQVLDTVARIAKTEADVLIVGETGTGKELVARSIHKHSTRSNWRFVPVDCGAIPEGLLESEFFGHERGAFTGADSRSLGLLEFADKGTFFLDEIAELPPALQAKLLRALQERHIRRVGGKEEIPVDVRVLAATSRDLEAQVREGRFREELYYRIHVARIEIPPLRGRTEDIPLLVKDFVRRHAPAMGRRKAEFDSAAIEVLSRYPWPGNVRELQNVVKRSLAMARTDRLTVDDLPAEVVDRAGDPNGGEPKGFFARRSDRIATFEREYFTELLTAFGGDVARAAEEARIPRGTLYRLLKKHTIDPSPFRRGNAR